MKGLVTVGLLAGLLLFAAPKRSEAGVHFSVGVGLPGFGAVVTSGPPYVPYPAYVYGPPAVYVPGPVYYPYYPRYRHYGHYYGHGRHYHGGGHRYRRGY